MDLTVITTYRCNSRCSMCHIWKYPTLPKEEVTLKTLEKLPDHIDNCNISGGEPTLRDDLGEMVDLLYPKSKVVEISTNGLHADKLVPIVKKYPDIKIRFSLEGFEETNDVIRGEKDGFKKKVEKMKKLIEVGGKDLGFGVVIQDENVSQLVDLYKFCVDLGVDLATSTLHNAFQFHKSDNLFYERLAVARKVEQLIEAQLKSGSIKKWFRAYLNLGLIEKILGHDRLIPCVAGSEFVFIDPWSDIYACNVRPDLIMGNLERQNWDEIWDGEKAQEIRNKVASCKQNCWMVTTARTAMRNPKVPWFPKWQVLNWVISNKFRLSLGKEIKFDSYINYKDVIEDLAKGNREKYLNNKTIKRKVTKAKDPHYNFGEFFNK